MKFNEVKTFFKSWGVFPASEDTEGNNPETNQINESCFNKMVAEAKEKHGEDFAMFVQGMMDANDDWFYLEADLWDDLQDEWDEEFAS